jgi:hypothetical protein
MIIENKINDIIDYKLNVNRIYLPRSANKLLPPFFIVLYLLVLLEPVKLYIK